MSAYKRTVISIKIWHNRRATFRSKLSFLRWPIFFRTACFSTPIWTSVIYQALLECIGSEKTFSLLKVLWRRNIDIYGRAKKLIITVCNTTFVIFHDAVGLRPMCILFTLYGSKQSVVWMYHTLYTTAECLTFQNYSFIASAQSKQMSDSSSKVSLNKLFKLAIDGVTSYVWEVYSH